MPDKPNGFNVNTFIKGSSEEKNMTAVLPVDIVPVAPAQPAPKKTTPRKRKETVEATVVDTAPINSMSYIQNNVPYDTAYVESKQQLDAAIAQLNALSIDTMGDLQSVRANKALKSKYSIMGMMTENAVNIISTKLSAIKEKNNIINNIQNLEIKRIKDLKIDQNAQDDTSRIAEMYNAFIQTTIGGGGNSQISGILAPPQESTIMPGVNNNIPRATLSMPSMGGFDDTAVWQQNLSPAQNRMLLQAKGVMDVVVIYDESSGNRRFAAVDKNTGQEIPNVELPSQESVWDLDLKLHGGNPFAKDQNRNVIYPVIIVHSGTNMDDF